MTRSNSVRERYDLICPNCGSDEDLGFQATTWFRATPTGLVEEECANREWQEWHECECDNCGESGYIADFRPKEVSS